MKTLHDVLRYDTPVDQPFPRRFVIEFFDEKSGAWWLLGSGLPGENVAQALERLTTDPEHRPAVASELLGALPVKIRVWCQGVTHVFQDPALLARLHPFLRSV